MSIVRLEPLPSPVAVLRAKIAVGRQSLEDLETGRRRGCACQSLPRSFERDATRPLLRGELREVERAGSRVLLECPACARLWMDAVATEPAFAFAAAVRSIDDWNRLKLEIDPTLIEELDLQRSIDFHNAAARDDENTGRFLRWIRLLERLVESLVSPD